MDCRVGRGGGDRHRALPRGATVVRRSEMGNYETHGRPTHLGSGVDRDGVGGCRSSVPLLGVGLDGLSCRWLLVASAVPAIAGRRAFPHESADEPRTKQLIRFA